MNILKTTGALGLTGLGIGLGIYTTTKKPKINLILDLDETLIHSRSIKQKQNKNFRAFRKADFKIENYEVWKRPYSSVMFTILRPFCNFHLYTSADKGYAEPIITKAGWNKHFSRGQRKYYDDAYNKNGCKNIDALDIAEPFFLKKTKIILVDDLEFNNCKNNYEYNYKFFHIPSYKLYNRADKELLKLSCKVIYEFFTQ